MVIYRLLCIYYSAKWYRKICIQLLEKKKKKKKKGHKNRNMKCLKGPKLILTKLLMAFCVYHWRNETSWATLMNCNSHTIPHEWKLSWNIEIKCNTCVIKHIYKYISKQISKLLYKQCLLQWCMLVWVDFCLK